MVKKVIKWTKFVGIVNMMKIDHFDKYRQSLVKTFVTFQVNYFSFSIKVPDRNMGNLKRAKVPSFPNGKLVCVHLWGVNT